ncbi:uncharacterized protein LOC105166369 isoform X2 [Sesamum indicum]|uniref:Uncharacterized protein LOC105166369 isoform X2 n=1 Tax=Sesamum indicum TaxID=4182 RepID=A0A8M8V3I2_SESIN|nr:uncharacterized protein LOC105166369 isoform X2 [Sesamum indicum]
MKEKSWACTLITQLSLCIAAYIALNIGQPQKVTHGSISSVGGPTDMYFISVAGGFRPLEEQNLLLQQMMKVAKTYKARFVVSISELGESDSLMQNAAMFSDLQKMPWYTSGALGGQAQPYFLKKVKIPYGQTLDFIALDTVLFQDPSSVRGNDQILWLTKTLKESDSDWRIVVGFHPLISCDYNIQKIGKETSFEPLHTMLQQYGADAYMSMKTCAGHLQGEAMWLSDIGRVNKGPHITAVNPNLASKEKRGSVLVQFVFFFNFWGSTAPSKLGSYILWDYC